MIQNNAINIAVENGESYSGKVDTVTLEVFLNNDAHVLVSVPYGSGKFTLKLPASLNAQYLDAISLPQGVTTSNPDVKIATTALYAYKSGAVAGRLYQQAENESGKIVYVDGDVSITGSCEETNEDGEKVTFKYNQQLKKGWNMVYTISHVEAKTKEITTQTPAVVKWILHLRD
ncbi:MAG: hypothetical protein LBJ57_03250 [Prevotellaceae bacterium]|nr:hypothetical protein [Prevotellaceae bacterium]